MLVLAKDHYETALNLNPSDRVTSNNLSWLLATSPDSDVRDGYRALELAIGISKGRLAQDPRILNTFAAAYAECAEFGKAIEKATEALKYAQKAEDDELTLQIEVMIRKFAERKPWRQED